MTARLGVLLLFLTSTAIGQTLYVSDYLVITLRTGPSTQNSIIANLVSGDAVDVLETNEDGSYARVRTEDGTEGWVIARYLADVPAAQDRLIIAERDLADAEVRIATLEDQMSMLTAELGATRQRLAEAETANSALSVDLAEIRDAAENTLTIRDQNESLRRRLNDREEQLELMTIENSALSGRATRDWFFAGAGVLLAGIVVGLIVPRLRFKRRRSDW